MFTGSLENIKLNKNTPSFCMSGSYKEYTSKPVTIPEALTDKKDEVSEYFESLGYEVSWDFNTRSGERWWEIIDKDGGMIVQIDMGVPLKYVIEDISCFHRKIPCIDRPDKPDWKFSGQDSEELTELMEKVHKTYTEQLK